MQLHIQRHRLVSVHASFKNITLRDSQFCKLAFLQADSAMAVRGGERDADQSDTTTRDILCHQPLYSARVGFWWTMYIDDHETVQASSLIGVAICIAGQLSG
jgi:hypothetical protein